MHVNATFQGNQISSGYAVFNHVYGCQSADYELIASAKNKLAKMGYPTLEVIEDGIVTVGTAVIFDRLSDVPAGVKAYQLS